MDICITSWRCCWRFDGGMTAGAMMVCGGGVIPGARAGIHLLVAVVAGLLLWLRA